MPVNNGLKAKMFLTECSAVEKVLDRMKGGMIRQPVEGLKVEKIEICSFFKSEKENNYFAIMALKQKNNYFKCQKDFQRPIMKL